MSLASWNNQIARYANTHHIHTEDVFIDAKRGIVKFSKFVITPIDDWKEIQMSKNKYKYSQYGGSSDSDSDGFWAKFELWHRQHGYSNLISSSWTSRDGFTEIWSQVKDSSDSFVFIDKFKRVYTISVLRIFKRLDVFKSSMFILCSFSFIDSHLIILWTLRYPVVSNLSLNQHTNQSFWFRRRQEETKSFSISATKWLLNV